MRPSNNPTAVSAVIGDEIDDDARAGDGSNRAAQLRAGLVMPLLLIAFTGYLVFGMIVMRVPEGTAFPGPRFFPLLIAIGMTLFAVLLAVQAVREWQAAGDAQAPQAERATAAPRVRVDWVSFAWVVGSFLVFALTLQYLGWVVGAALLFWCVARGFGERRAIASLIVGLSVSSFSYIAFDMLLGLQLPSGVLGWGF